MLSSPSVRDPERILARLWAHHCLPLFPEVKMVLSLLELAVRDAESDVKARRFLLGPDAKFWCESIGLDHGWVMSTLRVSGREWA